MPTTPCAWSLVSPLLKDYHDHEWGRAVHQDCLLFELLQLEAYSCGLSWQLVLNKRAVLREAFRDFEPTAVAAMDAEAEMERILSLPEMIRSPRKIRATIASARAFLKIAAQWGTFDRYLWHYTGGRTLLYAGHQDPAAQPTASALSRLVARDLKRAGIKYVGTVITYSYLQAVGIVCDHQTGCPCLDEIKATQPTLAAASDEWMPSE